MLDNAPNGRSLRARNALIALWAALALLVGSTPASSQTRQTITIRGHEQTLRLYGSPQGDPVIVSSGDGGWIHLGPHVAEFLGAHGFFVIGFDVKSYLESFTSGQVTLRPEEEPGDYRVLVELARDKSGRKPLLVGVSEGAGLSVLAATDLQTRTEIAGVIGLGLPDLNELGWRWKDALIYVTHRTPDEPMFSTAGIIGRLAPIPLAAIHSTHDEFVPVADIERVMSDAQEPKRLWVVDASDHRFSDNLAEFDGRLLEAIAWVKDHSPR
jgi:pimeloyl-ACP methyl ester carboxylesterase